MTERDRQPALHGTASVLEPTNLVISRTQRQAESEHRTATRCQALALKHQTEARRDVEQEYRAVHQWRAEAMVRRAKTTHHLTASELRPEAAVVAWSWVWIPVVAGLLGGLALCVVSWPTVLLRFGLGALTGLGLGVGLERCLSWMNHTSGLERQPPRLWTRGLLLVPCVGLFGVLGFIVTTQAGKGELVWPISLLAALSQLCVGLFAVWTHYSHAKRCHLVARERIEYERTEREIAMANMRLNELRSQDAEEMLTLADETTRPMQEHAERLCQRPVAMSHSTSTPLSTVQAATESLAPSEFGGTDLQPGLTGDAAMSPAA